MLCYLGKVSLYCFLSSCLPFYLLLLFKVHCWLQFSGSLYLFPILYYLFINVVVKLLYKGYIYQVAVRATFLGFILALGIYIKILAADHIKVFGVYMCVMAIFHYTEFFSIAYIQPKLVTVDSFVLNHSLQYSIAAITSWTEFFLESYLFPEFKIQFWLSNVGLIICIFGEVLRKAAMLTANSNFNHLVQCEKADDHILITHGVYSWFRHPSYVGWFYWSIGTQIILINPLCIIAYAIASWVFFRERITIEEIMLLNFFGQNYCDYQQKVRTGLPFIEGYKL